MKEIVAAMIGTTITTNPVDIKSAANMGTIKDLINRKRAQFMAAFDLGKNWELLAAAPTLFSIDDDGNIIEGIFKRPHKEPKQ